MISWTRRLACSTPIHSRRLFLAVTAAQTEHVCLTVVSHHDT